MKKLVLFLVLISSNCFAIDYANVPPEVVKKIIFDASNSWPNDYEMQNYCLESSISAYKKHILLMKEAIAYVQKKETEAKGETK